ncbi:SufD family Fe-S cluster assembly protein [Sphingosinicella sp.]|uniref:SufD family Fe-S cluster assembly protein n=1 Tax=Sphingosinicella sp. TaxID=1917971 RepID=UPI0035B42D55
MNARALPTRRDEAWRYSDLDALAEVWPSGVVSETIVVPAGERLARTIVADAAQPVSVRDIAVTLADGARLDLHMLNLGGRYGRIALDVTLGDGAHFELGAAQVAGGKTTLEIVTRVRHAAPNATSRQTVRTVLAQQATGTYLGQIVVDRGAQKTDAEQSVKAMLLDRTATANAKPELEIYADDVKCAHGATVGELDATQYFYLTSRGLPPSEAKRLLLQAFLADAYADMEDAEAREGLEAAALAALEQLA